MINLSKITIFNSLIIIFLSFSFFLHAEEYEPTDEDFEEVVLFATGASLSTFFHELGHLIIDEFNVPIFNNEEDVADSFMAWYLVHSPDEYDTYEEYLDMTSSYRYIIEIMSDYYYYLKLLDKDTDNEYSSHSTDNKRLYNIACFMKGADEVSYQNYIVKRRLDNLIDQYCADTYNSMYNAWWDILEDYWSVDLSIYEQKIFINYDPPEEDDWLTEYFREVSFEIFDYWVKSLQIILKKNYELSFEYCDGRVNAYYSSSDSKIIICYELIEEFMSTRYEIILLKNNL